MPFRNAEAQYGSAGDMALVPYRKEDRESYPPIILEGQEVNCVADEELTPPYEVQGTDVRRT